MDAFAYGSITRESLQYRLERESPENEDPRSGFALVFVQGADAFAKGHIPLSTNIPRGREHEFERRFEKTKEILVYGEDGSPWSATVVATALLYRGFVRVHVYEGGLRDWCDGGCPVEYGPDRRQLQRLLGRAGRAEAGYREPRRPAPAPAGPSAKSTSLRKNYTESPARDPVSRFAGH